MLFLLKSTSIIKLTLLEKSDSEDVDTSAALKHKVVVNAPLREFAVIFRFAAQLETQTLSLDYAVVFSAQEPIPEDFSEGQFAKVNAPAVAYPFLRAYVAQFAALSGFEPIYLPIRNFAS
jgi:preprotein translocase subunit SecB